MIYIIVLFVSLSIAYSQKPARKYGELYYSTYSYFWTCLPFLLITVLRYDVGTDYMQYLFGYYLNELSDERANELIFHQVINIAHVFDFPFFIILSFGIAVCALTFYAIYKLSKDVKQSIWMFMLSGFFVTSLSMMRQSAATAIGFCALVFLFQGDIKKSVVLMVISYLTHTTGIVYLLLGMFVIFISKHQILVRLLNPVLFLVFITLTVSSGALLRNQLQEIAVSTDVYEGYFGSEHDEQNASGTFLLYGVAPFISYMFAWFDSRWIKCEMKRNSLPYIAYTIMVWLSFATGLLRQFIPNGERIVFLFEPFVIFSLPYFISLTRPNLRNYSLYFSYFIFGICTFWYYFYKQSLDILPYHFIFMKDVDIW